MSNPNDKYTKEEETRFTLRIDTELLNKIKTEAERNKRSTAKEIEFMLEDYFRSIVEPFDKIYEAESKDKKSDRG